MDQFEQQAEWVQSLKSPEAFELDRHQTIEIHETHISYVLLAGKFAYKIKKAIHTPFLDYSTLALRQQACELELQLNRRYAPELYLDVVPITQEGTAEEARYKVCGSGESIDYAVRMHRFAGGSLLSEQLSHGTVTINEVREFANVVSHFHQVAETARGELADGWYRFLVENTQQLFAALQPMEADHADEIKRLRDWSNKFLSAHRKSFESRGTQGFIRACHGDLHCENVVMLNGRYSPFDGIEFNDRLRWIDTLSDVAFLAMDLTARNHAEFANLLVGTYLEHASDYESIELLPWYQFYRCMVRAMVDAMRIKQCMGDSSQQHEQMANCRHHLQLAERLIQPRSTRLWITYGLSGSGKTTVSERYMMNEHAIRLRSDVERKRMNGLSPWDRPSDALKRSLYTSDMSEKVYNRLLGLARQTLAAGYPVIVDATFLRRGQRQPFIDLANEKRVPWQILHCTADPTTLQKRLTERSAQSHDPSDADIQVLQQQQRWLDGEDRLTDEELAHTTMFPAQGQ